MSRRRDFLVVWLMLAMCVVPGLLRAQSLSLVISGLIADSTSPAPAVSLAAAKLDPDLGPYTFTLEMSVDPAFRTPFFVNASDDPSTMYHLDSLLSEHQRIYFRGRALDVRGSVAAQAVESHPVHSWLRIIEPGRAVGSPLTTRRPRFVWSSPPITNPPGPWVYDLSVINSATGQVEGNFSRGGILDTSFVFADSLQSNTSYRWFVRARTQNRIANQEVTVASPGTFVITSTDQPTFTLFYQNFPNPFGRGTRSTTTCFWFDLAHSSAVSLVIYDIRLRKVRTITPMRGTSDRLPVGTYGRENVSAQTGCDDRFSWDGRDEQGHYVPVGVYIAVFDGDRVHETVKMVFRGP